MNMSGKAIRYEQDTASFCVREREFDAIMKSIWSRLQRLRVAFLLKVYKTTKRLNTFKTEFIFETIKILTLEIKFIQHKNSNYV